MARLVHVDAVGGIGGDAVGHVQIVHALFGGDLLVIRGQRIVARDCAGAEFVAQPASGEGVGQLQRRAKQDLGRAAAGAVAARLDALDQTGAAPGDHVGRHAEEFLHVVGAQHQDHQIHGVPGEHAAVDALQAVAADVQRIVEHGGAAVEALLLHAVVCAQLRLEQAGPAHAPGEAVVRTELGALPLGHVAPGVGIAVAYDGLHIVFSFLTEPPRDGGGSGFCFIHYT